MKYTVDTFHNGVWITSWTELPDNTPNLRSKKKSKKRKLVNDSQRLVKDLVKEDMREEK